MEIREIRGRGELTAVEALQKEVWGCNDLEVVPGLHMIAAREVGAILVGAFDGGELIGFAGAGMIRPAGRRPRCR